MPKAKDSKKDSKKDLPRRLEKDSPMRKQKDWHLEKGWLRVTLMDWRMVKVKRMGLWT